MREINPRAWIPALNRYATGFDIICYRRQMNGEGEWWCCPAGEYEKLDVEIELPTGLKDKSGKEIYDGDILGGIWEDGYIAWCNKCKQLQYHISTHECMSCLGDVYWYELAKDDGKLEIIGNIHENGDLLDD